MGPKSVRLDTLYFIIITYTKSIRTLSMAQAIGYRSQSKKDLRELES